MSIVPSSGHFFRRPNPIAALFLAWLAAIPGAQALSLVEISLHARSTSGEDGFMDQAPLATGMSEGVTIGGTSVFASGAPGIGRVSVFTNWLSGDPASGAPGAEHDGFAIVGIYDSIVINRPTGNSDAGFYLEYPFEVSGSLTRNNGTATWFARAELRSLAYRDSSFAIVQPIIRIEADGRSSTEFGNAGVSLPTTLKAVGTGSPGTTNYFLYDVAIDLDWRFGVTANGFDSRNTGAAGSAQANLSDTLFSLGLIARDGQGQVIQGLTMTSESGYDWFTPVPLPATAWLLLPGLGAIGWRARRRAPR